MADMQIVGVMMDMARVTERLEYYEALPERLAGWGYNALFAHFTDDEGCAMEFKRRGELATPHAFSQERMRRFVAAAADAGVAVIPEIESFGHTEYIHGLKKYRPLKDIGPGQHYNAINPLHRQTRALMRDLIEETADVFDSPFIHAGLDEVNFGGSRQVQRALKTRDKWEIFADYIEFMRELVERTGRRMMMWGDHLLREPRIADRISRDIVICDWHYQPDVNGKTVEFFTSRGFEVVASPASNRSGDMILPNAITQINLQRFARIAHGGGPKVIGLMNTIWCPMRMLCGIEQFAMALGGAWFNDPEADGEEVLTEFVREHFGLARPDGAPAAILRLSRIMPTRTFMRRLMGSEEGGASPLTACELAQATDLACHLDAVRAVLTGRRKAVKRNLAEYDNYLLACDILNWVIFAGLARTLEDRAVIRGALAAGKTLVKRCQADWNRGRYPDDPKRDLDGKPGRWADPLIPNLHLAVTRLKDCLKHAQ